jgi:hypothetical protein
MTADQQSDLDVIAPAEGVVTIVGVPCRVKRVKLLELMLLARIVTAGAGQNLGQFDWSGDEEELQGKVIAVLVMAIPEAGAETVDLLRALVQPHPDATEADKKKVAAELGNPDPAVALDVIGVLAAQEKDTWPLLWGKARVVLSNITALYRTGKKGS